MKGFNGKIVKSIKKKVRGHYDYVEYWITFTDGSKIRFWGDGNADVNVEATQSPTLKCLEEEV